VKLVPHPYQHLIIDHETDLHRCNTWAGMGTGKTSSTLLALSYLQLLEPGPVLVIAPKRVALTTWPDEVAKWDQLRAAHRVVPVLGTPEARLRALRQDASVFTINYDNLPWLAEQLSGRWPFKTVVADESTRLKGFRTRQGTKRAKAIGRLAHSRVERWINLTGTPSPNGLKDLWGQNWFVDAGERLGRTYTAFQERWFVPRQRMIKGTNKASGYVQWDPLPSAQDQIEGKLKDVSLAIDARDWFDIKQPITNTIRVRLPAKAQALYTAMEKQMFMELEGFEVEAVHAASRTMKCLQIASGAAYVDDTGQWREIHDAKLEALESIIEEAAGAPVLVAYHWKPDLHRLLAAFPQGRHLDAEPSTIRAWNAGEIPVLFAHPQSAGHGLNLQDGGNILVFFSQWWDLEQAQQIIERIGPTRQAQSGHDRPVFIHYIVAEGTVDELVMERRESKKTVQETLMEAMKRRG
jgi:SNF2 family DNA or RNA helicase